MAIWGRQSARRGVVEGSVYADEIIRGSTDARVVLFDRRAHPGGRWNDAYPFVTLHQPAPCYGVSRKIDLVPINRLAEVEGHAGVLVDNRHV